MYIILANVMLILWASVYFANARSNSTLRIKFLKTSFTDLKSMIWPSVVIGLMAQGWRSDFFIQALVWRSQVWNLRRFLFSSSQGLLSFFWIILCFSLFYEISSYVLVSIALLLPTVAYVASTMGFGKNTFPKNVKLFSSIIFFTLILFFLELAFKNSSVLMQFLMESEIVFFYSHTRLVIIFDIFVIS